MPDHRHRDEHDGARKGDGIPDGNQFLLYGHSFVDTGLGVEVPEEWTENYYPSYIPDDYVLQFAHSVARNSEAEYVNARDEVLRIGVYSTTATVINTEKAKITHTTLHGVTATILEQPFGEVDIIWANGDRYFIISSDDYETTLAVAESVGVIQK